MKKYFENATSVERRFLIFVALVVFILLNLVFIRPLFSDWSKYKTRADTARTKLQKFETAIALAEKLKPQVLALEGEGMSVPTEEQAVTFMSAIQNQASLSGVSIQTSAGQQEKTNQFFSERVRALTLQAGENQLVDFLYNLGANSNSLIRVRALSLGTDAPRQNLRASVTLVASYQKKPPAKPAPAPVADKSKPAPAPVTDKPKSTPAAVPPVPGVPPPSTPTKK